MTFPKNGKLIMDRWSEFELFVQITELGSLSKAAEALSLSNASASRLLAALESRLGTRLIERNTRRLFVTDVGQDFYVRCKAAMADMQEAIEAVNVTTVNPVGVLRVTASLSLCLQLSPLLRGFTQRYPNVRMEMVAANRYYDIVDNNIDVAIRTREYEPDSNLVIRRLADTGRVLAASPAYLDRHGAPGVPQALAEHQLLLYTYANDSDKLTFRRGDEAITIPIKAMLEANDAQILRAAALQDMGILVQPTYVIYDDLVAGRLLPLMVDWKLPRLSINIVYQHRQLLPAKTRAFIDFLVENFHHQNYQQRWDSISSGANSSIT